MAVVATGSPPEELLQREWLAVNHLGGYASSTPSGLNIRKYHGLLVAAMSPPARRMVLLSRVEEMIEANGNSFPLSAAEYVGGIQPRGFERLVAFDSSPFPRWAYQSDGWTLQKELRLLPQRNAVLLQYTLLGCNSPVTLQLRPLLAMRGMHELMYQWNGPLGTGEIAPGHLRIDATARTPEVYLAHDGIYNPQPLWYLNHIYRLEAERGYAALEDLWTPGVVRWDLSPGRPVHFVCSADPVLLDQAVREASESPVEISTAAPPFELNANGLILQRAADVFVPVVRSDQVEAAARLVTQYTWSPASGRDALIALPGLFLSTHRFQEARILLDTFVRDTRGGVMPSVYPEDAGEPLYDAADVSLWFIHAVDRFLHAGIDLHESHRNWIDAAEQIVEAYQSGSTETSRLGIKLDGDGLVATQAAGIATTWMDAKCGDWVVTPRSGMTVEVNALWYNALCAVESMLRAIGKSARADAVGSLAAKTRRSFTSAFWNEAKRCCFDVVGDFGKDDSIRPNQLFAVSLPHAVLDCACHAAVLNTVRQQLLTPLGIRSLARTDAAYCGRYHGPPVARDRAQHQGSVYPWLLGAYADAIFRVQGNTIATRSEVGYAIHGCMEFMRDRGLGNLPELFDGDAPHDPGGATCAARNIGEILRVFAAANLASPTVAAKADRTAGILPAS